MVGYYPGDYSMTYDEFTLCYRPIAYVTKRCMYNIAFTNCVNNSLLCVYVLILHQLCCILTAAVHCVAYKQPIV